MAAYAGPQDRQGPHLWGGPLAERRSPETREVSPGRGTHLPNSGFSTVSLGGFAQSSLEDKFDLSTLSLQVKAKPK